MTTVRTATVEPRASVLIESMRDIGYSLQTAVADIVDNSITAGAGRVDILADTSSEAPAIGLLDDGVGMTETELLEAMRPGSKSPLASRARHDLGRFGLGLKTASFSQCRRVTVISRKSGATCCAIWDLDKVAETDKWIVELPELFDAIRWSDRLGSRGTLVVWEKLDRLVGPDLGDSRLHLTRQLDETTTHLELVFHRFLEGERGIPKLSMFMNGRPLEPFDPFNSRHPATNRDPEGVFQLDGKEIRIQPYTLPHHNKVSQAEWNRFAGAEGYVKNQGFYLYREKRLIIHGTWFNLARQTELTKLSRVRIDMPNGMDSEWKIDVKKASAQPPGPVRDRLKRLIDRLGASSRRAFVARGRRLVDDSRLPVWTRHQEQNRIDYRLNREHPLVSSFEQSLDKSQSRQFASIMNLFEAGVPIDAIFADTSSSPESVTSADMDIEAFSEVVGSTFTTLVSAGTSREEAMQMMQSAEPFRSNWAKTEKIVEGLDN